jgi:hypothetical protein
MGITKLQDDVGGKTGVWQKPGWWFWAVLLAGLAIRVYFVVFTEGTYDVDILKNHASGVCEKGLTGYYHANPDMNHPPFIAVVISLMLRAANSLGIQFGVFLRAPFAILDAGTTLLLLNLLRDKRYRFTAAACYWLNPLTIIFSAYQGNTDSAVAFSLLLCVWLLSKEKIIWAAAALGASFWVKLPGTMAIPALVFFVQGWRKRLIFLAVTGVVGISTYIPALLEDPAIVYQNVFGYRGQLVHTTAHVPVWGIQILLVPFLKALSDLCRVDLLYPAGFLFSQSWPISLFLIVLLCWLRRSCKTAGQLCLTIAGVYTILYGFSNSWSFQYFAWSIPFWFFAPPLFLIGATLLAGGYIYSLYWLLCGNPWLQGKWNFMGHPHWPDIVMTFRNLSVLFFFLSACTFLLSAVRSEIERWRKPANTGPPTSSTVKNGC